MPQDPQPSQRNEPKNRRFPPIGNVNQVWITDTIGVPSPNGQQLLGVVLVPMRDAMRRLWHDVVGLCGSALVLLRGTHWSHRRFEGSAILDL